MGLAPELIVEATAGASDRLGDHRLPDSARFNLSFQSRVFDTVAHLCSSFRSSLFGTDTCIIVPYHELVKLFRKIFVPFAELFFLD